MLKRVLSNIWVKRILGSLCVAFTGMLFLGGFVCSAAKLLFNADVSIWVFATIFFSLLGLLLGCVCLYACNPKLWDTVHNNRDNILFRLLPDIALIVEFVEYVG